MSKVQFNRVIPTFDYDHIEQDFRVYRIRYEARQSDRNYGRVINKIYQILQPLSLTYEFSERCYFVLLPQSKRIKSDVLGDDYAIRAENAENILPIALSRLLIGALPAQIKETDRFCSKAGLYYLQAVEDIQGVRVIRTQKISLSQDRSPFSGMILNVKGTTFTPVDYHLYNGALSPKLSKLPRFSFDAYSQLMQKDLQGEYIERGHHFDRLESNVISFSTTKIALFNQSKMGILCKFMADLQQYMGQYLSLEFSQIESDYRRYFEESIIKSAYAKIDEILKGYSINVINLVDTDLSPLLEVLTKEGFNVTESEEVKADQLNIAVHHDIDYYKEHSLEDPYQRLHPKGVITQSILVESLFNHKQQFKKPVYEACKKELLIKLEVHQSSLLLSKLEGHWRFIYAEKVLKDEKAPKDSQGDLFSKEELWHYHQLDHLDGKLSYQRLSEDDADEALLMLLDLEQKYWQYAVINLDENRGYIIEETDYRALPEYEKIGKLINEMATNHDQGIPKTSLQAFLNYLTQNAKLFKKPEELRQKIEMLLDSHQKHFYIEDFRSKQGLGLSYRGDGKRFYDWFAEEENMRLATSLRGRELGLADAFRGLFYNHQESLYFVGGINNIAEIIKHHNVFRRIMTSDQNVPTALLEMMEEFHIRHKQSTVYPFPFKHLHEYLRQQ